MKRRSVIILMTVILAFGSCTKERIRGNGSVRTENRNISGFTGVSTAGSSNIFISQGSSFKVEVRGYSNLLPYYETIVVNNILQLRYLPGVNVKNDNIEVYITMPLITDLSLAGSGNIKTTGVFQPVSDLHAFVAGSGNIEFSSGAAANFYSTISGSGNIRALNLVADKAETNTNGSGDTEITAGTQLKVRISGSGNVYYRGTPQISTNISGSGKVIPR